MTAFSHSTQKSDIGVGVGMQKMLEIRLKMICFT